MTERDAPAPAPALFLAELARLRSGGGIDTTRTPPPPRALNVDASARAETPSPPSSPPSSPVARAPAPTKRTKRKRSASQTERRRAFIASLEARRAAGCRPREIPQRVQASVRAIFEVSTGSEARLYLSRLPRAWASVVLRVATQPGDGRELDASLRHVWSRWVVACAWLLWSLRRRSKRNGFRAVVDGYTQGMLRALFRNRATGKPYSRARLFAASYRAGVGTCGPFVALRRAGLWFYAQPRTTEANPRFVGPPRVVGRCATGEPLTRRFAFAVYWLHAAPAVGPPATA